MTVYWLLVTGFILFEGLLENRLFCVYLSLVISNMRVFCSSPRPTIITTEHHSWEQTVEQTVFVSKRNKNGPNANPFAFAPTQLNTHTQVRGYKIPPSVRPLGFVAIYRLVHKWLLLLFVPNPNSVPSLFTPALELRAGPLEDPSQEV